MTEQTYTAAAFEIVLSLARNAIPTDPEMAELAAKYTIACDTLEDIAVNEYGDD